MCFFPLNLLPTIFPPSKLLGLMVNASHPNVLYASSNVLIVPLPLFSLMFFGFFTYQPIALSSTPNTQIFLFLPSTLLPLLSLVGKISITFSSNNPLLLLILLKTFRTISTTKFSLLELIAHHLTLLQRLLLPLSLFLTFHPSPSQTSSSSSCSLDLISPKILNDLSSFFYLIILNLINLSLATSKFPTSFKSSIVTPILKNPSLDSSIISNYRPISNLSFLSKILEKAIYLQLSNFFLSYNLLPPTQSGFRPSHSTETCLLKNSNDALLAFDSGKLSLLLSLDFSSAFDTVDHSLLLQHLNSSFVISGSSLSWPTSYLSNRFSAVSINNFSSSPLSFPFGVLQGSFIGPLLYILYTSHLPCLIESFSFQSQLFADDIYIFSFFPLSSLSSTLARLSLCLSSILSWGDRMHLKLNYSKFNFIYLSKSKSFSFSLSPIIISDLTIFFLHYSLSWLSTNYYVTAIHWTKKGKYQNRIKQPKTEIFSKKSESEILCIAILAGQCSQEKIN